MPREKTDPSTHHFKVSISFEPTQFEELCRYCQIEERSMSWVVRKALAEWLKKHPVSDD